MHYVCSQILQVKLMQQSSKIKQTADDTQISNLFSPEPPRYKYYDTVQGRERIRAVSENDQRYLSHNQQLIRYRPVQSKSVIPKVRTTTEGSKKFIPLCGNQKCKICKKTKIKTKNSRNKLQPMGRQKLKPPVPYLPPLQSRKRIEEEVYYILPKNIDKKSTDARPRVYKNKQYSYLQTPYQQQKREVKYYFSERPNKVIMASEGRVNYGERETVGVGSQNQEGSMPKFVKVNDLSYSRVRGSEFKYQRSKTDTDREELPIINNNKSKFYDGKIEEVPQYLNINGKIYEVVIEGNQRYDMRTQKYSIPLKKRSLKSTEELINPILENYDQNLRSWKGNKEEEEKQRQRLNSLVQMYIKYQTMFYYIKNNIRIESGQKEKLKSSPKKLALYRVNRDSLTEDGRNDFLRTFNEKDKAQIGVQGPEKQEIQNQQDEEKAQVYDIKFPTIYEVESKIKQYESLTGDPNFKNLRSLKSFTREYSNDPEKQFLYFGQYDHERKQRKGLGVLVTKKTILEGVWARNFIQKGAELKKNSIYIGQFKNNKRHGDGNCKWLNGEEYTGQWENGLRHGHGFWTSKGGQETYSGEWKNGKVTGYGEYNKKKQSIYKGYFQNFIKNGHGVQQFQNGDKFEGKYQNGVPNGFGKYRWNCGLRYEGEFKQGERMGKGLLKMEEVFIIEGGYEKQRPHGVCQLRLKNKDIFNGKFVFGQKYGFGKLSLNDSKRVKEGFWNHNHLEQIRQTRGGLRDQY